MTYSDRRLGALIAAAGLAVVLNACAAGPGESRHAADETSAQAGPDPIETLRTAAEREATHPAAPAQGEPADDRTLAVLDPASPAGIAARRPLSEILTELASKPAFEHVPQYPQPDPAVVTQAARLYASGREKAAASEWAGATADLEQASKLDPTSPEVWRELGDAQLASGKRLAATSSYTRAAECGSPDGRVWWVLGHDALRAGKPERAALFFAKAKESGSRASDPAVEYLVDAELGETLLAQGNLAAGIELITRGTDLPLPPPWGTRLRNELVDLLRRRADLRRSAGDAAVRLGETDAAIACYESAAEDGQISPAELLSRKARAMIIAGRSAGAALLVVESMADQVAPVSERQITLIRAMALDESVRSLMAPAIDSLAAASKVPGETAVKQWYRARAAALETEAARGLLREGMTRFPEAQELFTDLIATYDRGDAAGRAAEFIGLVERSGRTVVLAPRLLATSVDATGELAAFERNLSWASAVVRVPWLIGMGRIDEAYKVSQTLERGRKGSQAAIVAGASITAKAASGHFEGIDEDLAIVRESGADDPLLLARALTECQRFIEAYEAVPEIDSPEAASWPTELHLAASAYAVRGGRPGAGEAHALKAAEADPFDADAYEALAGLYSEPSPIADEQKLSRTIQSLRQYAPESRVVRWMAAQEMLARKLDGQAQVLLTELAEGETPSEPAMASLAMVLERRVALGPEAASQSQSQVQTLVDRWPETAVPWAGLARVLVAQGKAAEAEELLRKRLIDRPWAALAGQREAILRESLKQPDAARAAALERLSPRPRSIESTVSYAVELARDQKLEAATNALRSDLPAGSMLTTDQQNRLGALIAAEFQPADRAGGMPRLKDASKAAQVAALFDVLSEHGARLAPQMHQARIGAICQVKPVDIEALRRACEQAARDVPAIASAANRIAALELVETAHAPAAATSFLREAIRASAEPSTQLLVAYFAHVAEYGEPSDVDSLELTVGGVPGELAVLKQVLDPDKIPTDQIAIRAEFLYQFGGLSTTRGRRDLSKAALRKVLEIDPSHGMANNDLGYFYVEDREQPDQAELMLVRAFKARPDSHNVADSLGWLRYMQGRLDDWRDSSTGEEVLGAISLIQKAAELEGGVDNSTIQDHLGDVLWKSGQKEKAVDAWQRADSLLERDIARMTEELRQMPSEQSSAAWRRKILKDAQEEQAALKAKLAAAAAGREPPLPEMVWKKP